MFTMDRTTHGELGAYQNVTPCTVQPRGHSGMVAYQNVTPCTIQPRGAFRNGVNVYVCTFGVVGYCESENVTRVQENRTKDWVQCTFTCHSSDPTITQECIIVGCIPSAAVAVSEVGGGSAWVDVCVCPGGCLTRGIIPSCTEADLHPPCEQFLTSQKSQKAVPVLDLSQYTFSK